MHIFIVEAALTGHHSGYLERIAAAYMEAGHTVSVTVLQRDTKHLAIERLIRKHGAAFNVVPLDDAAYQAALRSPMGESGRELALRRIFGQMYRVVHHSQPVDYVFLPYLDYCLYALGLLGSPFGSTPWGGICMRPSFHYRNYGVIAPKPKLAKAKQALFLRLLKSKTLKSIYTIDELLHSFVVERHSSSKHRLQYLADPVELKGCHTYASARKKLSVMDEAVVILVYGAIDDRKGLDVLINAMVSPDVPNTLQLLVVGRQSAAAETLMASSQISNLVSQKRVHIINGFVDQAVEQMVFAAADIVWLGYRNHYAMSGVLVMAVTSDTPVIATHVGLIGWYTKERRLGQTVDIERLPQVVCALQLSANRGPKRAPSGRRDTFDNHNWQTALSKILWR